MLFYRKPVISVVLDKFSSISGKSNIILTLKVSLPEVVLFKT
jgi:hypothetical protein